MDRHGRARAEAGESAHRLDKKQVRVAFQRAAGSYDRAARVQKELADRLLEHLDPVRIAPELVVDLGAGTGDLVLSLSDRFRQATVVAVDIAESMLRVARTKSGGRDAGKRFLCADAERLPFRDASVDLVVSNATLQWLNNPDRLFAECLRALRPGGLLMFSTFGPDTLSELRQSFAEIDSHPHVHAFLDMHDLGDALVRAGFADVVLDAARLDAEYRDLGELLSELKAIGATNALAGRRRGLTGRSRLARLAEVYEAFRVDGMLRATYEAVFAHAWKPAARTRSVGVAPPVP